jgi:Cu(I)/Ag(I) efflux system protein CusF
MTMLAVPLGLSACDGGQETMDTEDMPMAESMPAEGMPMSEDMPMMGSDAEMQMASAEGTVTAVDDQAGTITVDHGPVPAVDWPAMTMAFEADADLRQEVAVGDEVIFDFRMSDSGNQITSISRK